MPLQSARQFHSPARILLIEDDAHDAELIRATFRDTPVEHELHVIPDTPGALAYLESVRENSASRPDLVILDLHLPPQSGLEILERMKRDAQLQSIPVLILTGSREERDVWRSYHLHANAYVVKPDDAQDFRTVLHRLAEFYLEVVLLPPHTPPAKTNA